MNKGWTYKKGGRLKFLRYLKSKTIRYSKLKNLHHVECFFFYTSRPYTIWYRSHKINKMWTFQLSRSNCFGYIALQSFRRPCFLFVFPLYCNYATLLHILIYTLFVAKFELTHFFSVTLNFSFFSQMLDIYQ